MGGHRAVSFPIVERDRRVTEGAEYLNSIVLWRNLFSDTHVITEKLQHLGRDANGVHGDLQVILSALKRMQRSVELMLAMEEGDTPRAAAVGGAQ